MAILTFDKPKKVRSTEEHNNTYVSDTNVAGTYVPNMTDADNEKWKAKHIKGSDERVEIRKCFRNYQNYSQVLIKVYKDGVKMSMNGTTGMTNAEYEELLLAIQEAKTILGI